MHCCVLRERFKAHSPHLNLWAFPNTPFELAQCASREDASYDCNSTYFPEVIDWIVETIIA
jgi:hypothetical protein